MRAGRLSAASSPGIAGTKKFFAHLEPERGGDRTKSMRRKRRNTSKPEALLKHHGKARSCLMCGRTFNSQWYGHRVCSTCKETRRWRSGE